MKQHIYPCPLSETGVCEFAGTRHYNYGFVRGRANFCGHKLEKRFVSDIKKCPKLTPTPKGITNKTDK